MLVQLTLCVLSPIALLLHFAVNKAEARLEVGTESLRFQGLQRRYLYVYLLATFADWLQGPYVYKLYSFYGYTESQIAVLYVVGFVSSFVFGTAIGSLADLLGRKKLCVVYCILYSICCLTKATPNYEVLMIGRVLGGISTSILFSTFEAWYIHEHIRHHFPQQWVNFTMSASTFYNALLAILAGIVANLVAEYLDFGPVSPFLLAIPCLLVSGMVMSLAWEENELQLAKSNSSYFQSLKLIFTSSNYNMLYLGTIQSIFESVMYTFVFLWTPVLSPMSPPLGYVFSCFMICIMIGSSVYAYSMTRGVTAERLLTFSTLLALVSLAACTFAASRRSEGHARFCFATFVVYEISVGMYFPAVGYLRSRVLPEEFRASVTNWFRVPMNFMVCCSLLLLREDKTSGEDVDDSSSSQTAFLICSCLLLAASFLSSLFSSTFSKSVNSPDTQILI